MNNNQNIQKSDPKRKAAISLILGIISIIANISIIIIYSRAVIEILLLREIIEYIAFFSLIVGWLFPIVGFILGIISLKSTKKKLAITGIILSLIGLIGYIYIFLIVWRIGTA